MVTFDCVEITWSVCGDHVVCVWGSRDLCGVLCAGSCLQSLMNDTSRPSFVGTHFTVLDRSALFVGEGRVECSGVGWSVVWCGGIYMICVSCIA